MVIVKLFVFVGLNLCSIQEIISSLLLCSLKLCERMTLLSPWMNLSILRFLFFYFILHS